MNFLKLVKKILFATYKLFFHGMQTSARSEPDQNFQTSRSGHCQTWARSDNRLPWNFSTWGIFSKCYTIKICKNAKIDLLKIPTKTNPSILCSYTGKNSSIKFIKLFKSWGYRHLRNRVLENLRNKVLENLQNFLE